MINDILKPNEILSIQSKYGKALQLFSRNFNNAKQKKKYMFLYPIRASGLSFKHAKSLGYRSSWYLWNKCLDQRKRNSGFFSIISSLFFMLSQLFATLKCRPLELGPFC
jgi:hypothetical protein